MVYGADLESLSPVTGTGGSNPPFSFFNSHLMKKIIILNLIFLIFVFFAFDYFIFCQARQKYGLEMSYYENCSKKINRLTNVFHFILLKFRTENLKIKTALFLQFISLVVPMLMDLV